MKEVKGIGMVIAKQPSAIDGVLPIPIPSDCADVQKFANRNEPVHERIFDQLKGDAYDEPHTPLKKDAKRKAIID